MKRDPRLTPRRGDMVKGVLDVKDGEKLLLVIDVRDGLVSYRVGRAGELVATSGHEVCTLDQWIEWAESAEVVAERRRRVKTR